MNMTWSHSSRTFYLVIAIAILSSLCCQSGGVPAMNIRVLKLTPTSPLDPYKRFTIKYAVENATDSELLIPDLNMLEIEIKNIDSAISFRQTLKGSQSFESKALDEISILPPYLPVRLTVSPKSTLENELSSQDQFPPLLPGANTITLRLPLADNQTLVAPPYQFMVTRLQPQFRQEIVHGTAYFSDERLRQELLLFSEDKRSRLIFLKNKYPGFLSVIEDTKLPNRPSLISLLHYWPAQEVRDRIVSMNDNSLAVYEIASDEQNFYKAMTAIDKLPLESRYRFVGLIYVSVDDHSNGIDDYILAKADSTTDGVTIIVEYWKRTLKSRNWHQGEIARFQLPAAAGIPELMLDDQGFKIDAHDSVKPCRIQMLSKLDEYRQKALNERPFIR